MRLPSLVRVSRGFAALLEPSAESPEPEVPPVSNRQRNRLNLRFPPSRFHPVSRQKLRQFNARPLSTAGSAYLGPRADFELGTILQQRHSIRLGHFAQFIRAK